MKTYEIISKKRYGLPLNESEIGFIVQSFTNGDLPDYQMAALLMAITINGMDAKETFYLTKHMVETGDTADLSGIHGIKVDKHSSGGVGDKTSPIVGSIVAACGVPVAKMSGRSLGFSGGTIDKLESIPGYRTEMRKDEFFKIVNTVGVSIIAQTGNLAPADKKIYQLRDVTATVESLPLIASSIMSKKIAGAADALLLDVKVGNGAFMKDLPGATALAKEMVSIGNAFGKQTTAVITQMSCPLGRNIGTALEIVEVVGVLRNEVISELSMLCIELAANMLHLAGLGALPQCRAMAEDALVSGRAYQRFQAMIAAHGGDFSAVENTDRFHKAAYIEPLVAAETGYIAALPAEKWGLASMVLGAGRNRKDDPIDYSAGICLHVGLGDHVEAGDTIATLHTDHMEKLSPAREVLAGAVEFSQTQPERLPLIYQTISGNI